MTTGLAQELPTDAPVTAVVVTAGYTHYLPRTLAALAAQTRRPARVLLVDVGGPGGVPRLLDETFAAAPPGPVPRLARVAVERATTFGRAVSTGLATLDVALGEPRAPWVWLLHDDAAPEPDALAELVRVVGQSRSVAVAGVKQRTWDVTQRLLEVGLRTTPWGRRMTDVEPGEPDQGQLDGRSDMLAVGLAGALVRRDVWDALGGPDPALGDFDAGLDLCRRVRLAGHRVVVVPSAVVRHAQAGYRGLRRRPSEAVDDEFDAGDPRRSAARRRRSAVHGRLVATPLPLLAFVAIGAVLAAALRAVWELAYGQPDAAAAQVRGAFGALARPRAVWRARRRAWATRRLPRRTLWPLQASWREVWTAWHDRRLARREVRRVQRAPSELEIHELAAAARRRRATLGALAVVLAVASAIGFGPLLGPAAGDGSHLVGGALADASSSLGDLWTAATSGWVWDGLGSRGPADPLLMVLWVLAAACGGQLAAAVNLLMLGAVLLAGLGAWAAAGAATRSAGVRAWAGVVWAAAPPLLLAVDHGELGAVLAHVGLPWVALGVARAVGVQRVDQVLPGIATAATPAVPPTRAELRRAEAIASTRPVGTPDPVGSIAAAAGAALALAVVVAGAPVLVIPAVAAVVVLVIAVPRRRWRLAFVPLPALVLAGPLLIEVLGRGRAGLRVLAAGPGLPVAATPAVAWQRLLGLPAAGGALVPRGIPGAVAQWWPLALGLVVAFLALLALLRGASVARGVRVAWLITALGLATATGVALVPVAVSGDAIGPAWTGAPLSLALLGLLAAAVLGTDRLSERLVRRQFGWRQLAVVVASVVAGLVALGSLGSWAWTAPDAGGLRAQPAAVVPAVAQQDQLGANASRVLTVSTDAEGASWTLLRADGGQLVDSSSAAATRVLTGSLRAPAAAAPDPATAEVDSLVAELAHGTAANVSGPLAALAISDVLVPPANAATAASRATLVAHLDATAGLQAVTTDASGTLWRVVAAGDDGAAVAVTAWARLEPGDADPSTAAVTTTASAAATAVASNGRGVDATLGAGDPTRALVLAERADPGWHATLNGQPLRAVDNGWRQTFEVGAAGGHLVVWYQRTGWLTPLVVVTIVTVLLAIPLRRRRGGRA